MAVHGLNTVKKTTKTDWVNVERKKEIKQVTEAE